MSHRLLVDLITEDPNNDEWVLYLLEDGPWDKDDLPDRLHTLQDRIYNALEAITDGHVGRRLPNSKGRKFRVQVDCNPEAPPEVEELVVKMNKFVCSDNEYQTHLKHGGYARDVRITTRMQMGRSS